MQNDEVKIKTLKTKSEKVKIKTKAQTKKQNDEVKIKTLKTKTEKYKMKTEKWKIKTKSLCGPSGLPYMSDKVPANTQEFSH